MDHQFSSVQFSRSVVSDSLRPHESQHARTPCPSQTRILLKLMSIESVMPSSHLILCHPLLLLLPILPSIRVFSNESTLCMKWPKYWSFSFSISPCNEHPGLISFRMDLLDLLANIMLKGDYSLKVMGIIIESLCVYSSICKMEYSNCFIRMLTFIIYIKHFELYLVHSNT